MKKKNKKPKPQDFQTREEHEEALEEYYQNQPIYVVLNFILGHPKKIKNTLTGKPGGEPPPY